MSLSINRHSITTSYDHSVKANENKLNSLDYNTAQKKAADSLELSKEFAEYAGGVQASLPTENYSRTFNPSEDMFVLTTDQQKSLLSDLQSYLASSDASATTNEIGGSTASPLASISELLSGQDFSAASDEDISDLFDQVAEIMQSQRPEPPPTNDSSRSERNGTPPMMQAMGGIMPPFAWNIQENSNEQNQDSSMNNELTVDEKKSLLSELQNLISSSGTGASSSGEDEENDLLAALKNAWGNTDTSTAGDEEISALFDKIAKLFN
ncbi:hypothetical protein [Paenibacillus sp. OK003]|uniref:hypothetical protein n=1 Tax=Paenibacillus sp. OK003 TaxID=1884380 RepID=UPI0008D44BF3|nr:hypothetical protein [Paenibacillus sp. OK003]SEL93306.1 hypothetical protein SAMN05518856_12430 [Paenibacillus sp. OK003]